MSGRFRREDVRGRWDGDTFVVGFDGSSARAVVEVVRRLQEDLDAQRIRQPEELSFLHMALGLASYPLDGEHYPFPDPRCSRSASKPRWSAA